MTQLEKFREKIVNYRCAWYNAIQDNVAIEESNKLLLENNIDIERDILFSLDKVYERYSEEGNHEMARALIDLRDEIFDGLDDYLEIIQRCDELTLIEA